MQKSQEDIDHALQDHMTSWQKSRLTSYWSSLASPNVWIHRKLVLKPKSKLYLDLAELKDTLVVKSECIFSRRSLDLGGNRKAAEGWGYHTSYSSREMWSLDQCYEKYTQR